MREDAVTATKTLNNKLYEGRKLAIDFAKAKDRPKRKSMNAEVMSESESEVWCAVVCCSSEAVLQLSSGSCVALTLLCHWGGGSF